MLWDHLYRPTLKSLRVCSPCLYKASLGLYYTACWPGGSQRWICVLLLLAVFRTARRIFMVESAAHESTWSGYSQWLSVVHANSALSKTLRNNESVYVPYDGTGSRGGRETLRQADFTIVKMNGRVFYSSCALVTWKYNNVSFLETHFKSAGWLNTFVYLRACIPNSHRLVVRMFRLRSRRVAA